VIWSVIQCSGLARNIIVPLLARKLALAGGRNATNAIAVIAVGTGPTALHRSHVVMLRHGRGSDDGCSEQGSRKKFKLGHLGLRFLFEADALGFITEMRRAPDDSQSITGHVTSMARENA
jgi:hypothetical protein